MSLLPDIDVEQMIFDLRDAAKFLRTQSHPEDDEAVLLAQRLEEYAEGWESFANSVKEAVETSVGVNDS